MTDIMELSVCLAGALVSAVAGHYVVDWVTRLCYTRLHKAKPADRRVDIVLGGTERISIFVFVMLLQYLGVAAVIAAKGALAARSRGKGKLLEANRQIVRTLASILFAIIVGLATKHALAMWFQ